MAADEGKGLTLWEIEQELVEAFDDWHESLAATPEAREEALEEVLKAYLEAAVEKRDRVAQFISHLESQSDAAKKEIERLTLRKRRFDAKRERMLAYLDHVMQMRGVKKLEGKQRVIKRRKCPPSLVITDPSKIPAAFLTHEVKETWTPDKKRIKEELKVLKEMGDEDPQVAGTRMVDDKYKVVIE